MLLFQKKEFFLVNAYLIIQRIYNDFIRFKKIKKIKFNI